MTSSALGVNPDPNAIDHSKVHELTDVITHHSPRFRRIALARLGNAADAEDAVQDALLSALTHVDQFRGQARMSTWLTAIVINSARMKLRRHSGQAQISLDETVQEQNSSLADFVPDSRPSPEDVNRDREIVATLARATSRLSPTLRTTFELRYVDGLSIRETAYHMGVPTGTVKARLVRARVRLRQTTAKRFRRNVDARHRP
jgi:RNA polymerase sigma-70 factor, ECF subfamily